MRLKATWEVALLIADMMAIHEETRARISDKTLKLLAGRVRLEGSIRSAISVDLEEHGYVMIHLNNGRGSAIVKMSALEGAKQFTLANTYDDEYRKKIIKGDVDYDEIYDSLGIPENSESES